MREIMKKLFDREKRSVDGKKWTCSNCGWWILYTDEMLDAQRRIQEHQKNCKGEKV